MNIQEYIEAIGDEAKAEYLMYIWNTTCPEVDPQVKREVRVMQAFRIKAMKEGFTDKQIDAFFKLK
jgi:hypothetical protein